LDVGHSESVCASRQHTHFKCSVVSANLASFSPFQPPFLVGISVKSWLHQGKTGKARDRRENMYRRAWITVAILFFQLTASPALATNQGWVLNLTSEMAGKMSIIWNKDALRMTFHKSGLVAIIKGPRWKVQFFSNLTKKYCEYSFEEFRAKFGQRRAAPFNKVIACNKTARIVGLKASEYICARADKSGEIDWSEKSEEWITKDLHMPGPTSTILSETAALPKSYGLPIRIIRYRNNLRASRAIDAVSYGRIAIKPDDFIVPSGYRRVADEVSVIMEEDMESLLDAQADYLSKEASRRQRKFAP
jgi:hypothetical protein